MRGPGLSVVVLDESANIGGVWYSNRYPGARCDVESFDYSYTFSDELEQEWRWSERYATQPEILSYVNHVADRFDLRRDIHCNQRVVRAAYDEDARRWNVETEAGGRWNAHYLILAVGPDALSHLDAEPTVRVGIVTGPGGTFCAGIDVKAFLAGAPRCVEGLGFAGLTEDPDPDWDGVRAHRRPDAGIRRAPLGPGQPPRRAR